MPRTEKEISKTALAKLDDLIDEATIDCYDEDEQVAAFASMIVDNVEVPFAAHVVGEPVKVVGFKETDECPIIKAVCERGNRRYGVDLSSVEWTTPLPKGFEWIEAYLEWRQRL